MTREWESASGPTASSIPGSTSLERLSRRLGISAGAAYAVLFCVMWLPVLLADYEGWLFLFPIFLLLWVPVELLAITSVVVGVVGIARSGRSRSWVFVGLLALFAVVSLPILWFGALIPRG